MINRTKTVPILYASDRRLSCKVILLHMTTAKEGYFFVLASTCLDKNCKINYISYDDSSSQEKNNGIQFNLLPVESGVKTGSSLNKEWITHCVPRKFKNKTRM